MNHSEVLSTLHSLLPEVVQTGDAEGTLLKRAMQEDMSPAQLERLCQIFNAAKTASVMKKYASDRGRAFELIDAATVLARYANMRKEAADLRPKPAAYRPGRSPYDSVPTIKWASETGVAEIEAKQQKAASNSPGDNELDALLARQAFIDKRAEAHLTLEFLAEVRDNAATECTNKIAQFIQDHFSSPYVEAEQFAMIERDFNAIAVGGSKEKAAFMDAVAKHVEERCGQTVKRASTPSLVAVDRTGKAGILVEAWDNLCMIPAAQQLLKEAAGGASALVNASEEKVKKDDTVAPSRGKSEGAAAPAPAAGAAREPKPGDITDYVYSLQGGSQEPADVSDAANQIFGALDTAGGKTMNLAGLVAKHYPGSEKEIASILLGKTDGQIADRVDRALFRDTAGTTIAELAVSDPVISRADPELVQSLAATILKAAPSVAADKNLLRIALREAVQYGAVPTHTVTELADLERKLRPASPADKDGVRS